MEILARISQNSSKNKEEVFTRLYRYLLRPDIYYEAYRNLYANSGAETKGVNEDTADGFSEAKINHIIKSLETETYQPKPARRTYIQKSNGKMRPLGIPSFDDKLIQEVVRLILESIYEPTFSDYSHGFRINKSCHTALKYVQKYFTGTKWFVEGDIKGCFDNVDHHVLIDILRKRIADEHFIGLLWKFLKAGYMEDWNYHNTYSGTPQGSIISPILANIYMNELDNYIAEYAEKFNCGNRRKINPAFKKKLDVCRGKEQRLKRNLSKMSEKEKEGLIAEIRELRRSLKSMPYSDQMDDSYKRICYVRYADDFVIVTDTCAHAEDWKARLQKFLKEKMKLTLSQEKTLITDIRKKHIKFLGFEFKMVRGKSRRGYIPRTIPDRDRLKRKVDKIAHNIKKIPHNYSREKMISAINRINSQVRGLIQYYQCCTWVNISMKKYSRRLQMVAKTRLKQYKGKWIPANQTQNLPRIHHVSASDKM